MKKLAFALLAATTLGFVAPAFAAGAPAAHDGLAAAQTDVSAQRRVVRKVIIRHGHGMHRPHFGRHGRVVKKVIRRGPMGRTVVRKTIRR